MKQNFTIKFLIFVLLVTTEIHSQKLHLTGKVFDAETKTELSYANLRVIGRNICTIANLDGNYKLNLTSGLYNIIVSSIGYLSDTLKVDIKENKSLNFFLIKAIPKVDQMKSNNFVANIIEHAIETKNKNRKKIKSYKYSSYTKGIIKTTRDFSQTAIDFADEENDKLKITGMLEKEIRGFYKAPNKSKFFIVAGRQTKNIPQYINAMTGGIEIQNFYDENIEFMGRYIPSPISKRALKYYDYSYVKEIVSGKQKVFQISFKVKNPSTLGFYGNLFISDSSFALLKAEAYINSSANPGGIFKYVKIFQQFSIYENDIILPVDYHLIAEGNYLGLAEFALELNSVMYNYRINFQLDDDIFNRAILTVLPDAYRKDKSFWESVRAIPNTREEKKAYSKIRAFQNKKKIKVSNLLFSSRIKLSEDFLIMGPLSIYNFNKVEGSNLGLGIYYNDVNSKRLTGSINLAYGFADKKIKKEFRINYLLGKYRTTSIDFFAYDKITSLFNNSDNYNKFTSTWLSLLTKYDFRDYYYTKGFKFGISGDVSSILNLGLGYVSKSDLSARNNSDFSFFYKKKKYSTNLPVYDTKIHALLATFKLDFRKFIEDGFFIKKLSMPNIILFEGEVFLSNKQLLKSDSDFQIYRLETYGRFPTFLTASLNFDVTTVYSSGSIPFQMLYALSGNINIAGKNNSFRTLRVGEVFGDRVTAIYLTHNFRDELFKLLKIPYLKRSRIQLKTYLNVAWSEVTGESKNILPISYKDFKTPFYELGFSIGHFLFPMTLEFTWKLNYRGRNNFVFGVNTFIL